MSRVLCCGSRDWSDFDTILRWLKRMPTSTTIIHGGATREPTARRFFLEWHGVMPRRRPLARDPAASIGNGCER